jgi:hypothetical protein
VKAKVKLISLIIVNMKNRMIGYSGATDHMTYSKQGLVTNRKTRKSKQGLVTNRKTRKNDISNVNGVAYPVGGDVHLPDNIRLNNTHPYQQN